MLLLKCHCSKMEISSTAATEPLEIRLSRCIASQADVDAFALLHVLLMSLPAASPKGWYYGVTSLLWLAACAVARKKVPLEEARIKVLSCSLQLRYRHPSCAVMLHGAPRLKEGKFWVVSFVLLWTKRWMHLHVSNWWAIHAKPALFIWPWKTHWWKINAKTV